MKIYKIASLFSGCGGLDLGFCGGFEFMGKSYSKLPTKIVFANDFDKDATTCYNNNPLLVEDGEKCLLEDIRDISIDKIPDFDILTAGFPCQPFSNAGNRKGVNDDNGRGTLFEECQRILQGKIDEGKKPLAFVFENVRGILSSKMPDGTTVPQEIKTRMENMGYNVSIQLVCSSDYGVPQNRYRVLIVGIDQRLGKTFNFKTMDDIVGQYGIPSVSQGNDERLLVGSILQDLDNKPDSEYWLYSTATQNMIELIGGCEHGEKALDLFKGDFNKDTLPPIVFKGRSWKNIDPDKLTPRFKNIYDNPKKYHAPNFFRRFAFSEINGTITASSQPEKCGITHPVFNRRYTVREIARIQSFPDNYLFSSIPLQSRYKVIGNAVPPVMGWVVAKALIKTINGEL
jgi:DNA (cytosine-5)-methyltransferase 1